MNKARAKNIATIIEKSPGITGSRILDRLIDQSRSAKWFGKDSFLTAVFGPGVGTMYVILAELERQGQISSHWGLATEARNGNRPRHYYPKKGTPYDRYPNR